MDPLILIAGTAALVWGVALLRWGGLLIGCLLVLLAGSCFGHAFFHISVLTADRVFLTGLALVYLFLGRFGFAVPKPIDRYDVAMFSFLGYLFISVFTHDWWIKDAQPVADLLFLYCLPAAMYWLARESPLDRQLSRVVLGFFTVFGSYLALTGIAERYDVSALVFPNYIMSASHWEFFGRARGPFLNPISLGIYFSACASCTAMFWPRLRTTGRAAVVAILVVISFAAYCTMTRSVWLGLGASICLIVALSIPKKWHLPFALAICVAGSSVVVSKWSNLQSFKRDKDVSVEAMAESARLRPILAAIAWRMFKDQPWFGVGLGQYLRNCDRYLEDRNTELVLEKGRRYVQHNVFLAMLVQNGIIGLGLFAVLLITWSWRAWRLWRCKVAPLWAKQHGLVFLAALTAFLVNGLFHDVGIMSMVNMLIYLLAGINANVTHFLSEKPRRQAASFRTLKAPHTPRLVHDTF